jgi:hypothetical protein
LLVAVVAEGEVQLLQTVPAAAVVAVVELFGKLFL